MGLENREYLRDSYDDSPQWGGHRRITLLAKLIGVTVGVFILQLLFSGPEHGSWVTDWLRLTSDDLYFRGQVWRLMTYAFCHDRGSLLHLIFNMLMLYTIGGMLISLLGEREFLWFYLASAAFAGLMWVLTDTLTRQLTNSSPAAVVGASGAVYAVFCVVAMHFPRQQLMLFGAIAIEIRMLLAIFIGMDFLTMAAGNRNQVAWSAHFGGLLFGFLYVRLHMRLTRWWDNFAGRVAIKRRNRNLRIFAPPHAPESNLDARVDQILDKISREGEASLSARERNILTQASRQLRKDRR